MIMKKYLKNMKVAILVGSILVSSPCLSKQNSDLEENKQGWISWTGSVIKNTADFIVYDSVLFDGFFGGFIRGFVGAFVRELLRPQIQPQQI